MKVGVFCIQPDADADPAIVARHAEDIGFSSYWVPDHIILPVTSSTKYPGFSICRGLHSPLYSGLSICGACHLPL